MRRLPLLLFTLCSFLLLTGMGSLGGAPKGGIPHPSENFAARVVDRSGTATDLSQFSMDGAVFLEGRRGDGTLAIAFAKIKGIEFAKPAGDMVTATVHLKSGQDVALQVKPGTVFYGDPGYGAFRIDARDLARIDFHQ